MKKILEALRQLYNKAISKIGIDRVAHFALYGFIVALAGMFGFIPSVVACVVMWMLSILKEGFDGKCDWYDVIAGVTGGGLALIISAIANFI